MMDIAQLLDAADLMVATQRYDSALATYNQILIEKHDCDEAYLLRGELYGKLGQYEKAFDDVLKAISIDPGYDEAYMVMARLFLANNKPEKAIESYQKAIALNNKIAISQLTRLGEKLADQQLVNHQPDKALENYKLVLAYQPDNISLLYKYAFAMSRSGDFEKTFVLIERILKKSPDHVPTKSLLVATYEKTGQREKGWELIKTLAEAYPENANINIIFGKYALQNNQQKDAISRLRRIDEKSGIKPDDKLSINMLLGKLYDSIEDYKAAFSYFSQANDLKYNDYDVGVFEAEVTNIINFYSKENFHALPTSTNNSSGCIFILGMPRSGTSLIEQIISSHSRVFGGGELPYVPQTIHAITESRPGLTFPQVLNEVGNDELNAHANKLLASLKLMSPDAQIITDKLPHNFLYIGLIHKLLPDAKIINCIRNPIDNCLSCYFQHFGGYHPYAYNLNHLARYYKQYQRLMRHWELELEIPIFNVHYEDVVDDTKKQVEDLLNFLALDWEEGCLAFYKNKRTVHTASYTQVERKIYTESMQRWKNYEPYIQEFISAI